VSAPPGKGAAPPAQDKRTFCWTGLPKLHSGPYTYFDSFQFCGNYYSIGEHVYLTPEDAGSPPYLGRITNAFEDSTKEGGDRFCIQVGVQTGWRGVAAALLVEWVGG